MPGKALSWVLKFREDKLDRTILPIAEPTYVAITELDVRNTQPPPRFEVTAPKGAPNVIIVLIDDLGFGATNTFGGPIPTPTFDRWPTHQGFDKF